MDNTQLTKSPEEMEKEIRLLRDQMLWMVKSSRNRTCPLCFGEHFISDFKNMSWEIVESEKGFPLEPGSWEEWIEFSQRWQKVKGFAPQGEK